MTAESVGMIQESVIFSNAECLEDRERCLDDEGLIIVSLRWNSPSDPADTKA